MRLKFDRLAVDANAAIDWLRPERPAPPPFATASQIVMPLFVYAELRLGFSRSAKAYRLIEDLEGFVRECFLLGPDKGTAEVYVEVRNAYVRGHGIPSSRERQEGLLHDLWISALCLQHRLPLLTNDRDYDRIAGLTVVHW